MQLQKKKTFLKVFMCRFINNELNLSKIKVYGFDYDVSKHTISNQGYILNTFQVYAGELYR